MIAFRILLASTVAVVAIAAAAWVDHDRKGAAMRKASVAAWFCAHKATRCGRDDPREVEQRWQARERAYAAGLGLSTLVGALALVRWRRAPNARS